MGAVQQLMMAHKAAAGGAIVYDTFTGTNFDLISAHSPTTGGAWTADGGEDTFIHTNRAIGAAGNHRLHNAATPPSADYDVEATVYFLSTGSSFRAGVRGRWDTGAVDYYQAWYNGNTGNWELDKVIGGGVTNLDTFADSPSATNTRTVRLKMTGTSLEVFIDGVSQMTATDGSLTAADKAGFVIVQGSDTTGYAVDTFWAGANGGTVGP